MTKISWVHPFLSGINFILSLFGMIYEIILVVTLDDLKKNFVSAKDFTDQMNPLFIPILVIDVLCSILSVFTLHKWLLLLYIPILAYRILKIVNKTWRFDFTQIRRNDVLRIEERNCYARLAFYVVMFIFWLVFFILDIVNKYN
ncbi:putative protein cornichon [Blattamonas nauphoetae]|uniref:Cornichon n=1 Tax=Blattamonas nauphoetae TaxID=2049346 RepID=A0ABQ9WVT4_9EUKA|nr:putative protein cornichon [Blattamonas nauphoetae]